MASSITTTTVLEQSGSATGGGGGGSTAVGGGGGVSNWDDLNGTLSGDVPFETVDKNGDPVARGATFDDDYDASPTPKVTWERDPSSSLAARVRDEDTGVDLLTVSEGGQTSAKTLDVEQTLTIPEKGDGAGQYIGDADFELARSLRRDTSTDADQVNVVLVDGSGSEFPTTTLGDGTEAYQIDTSGQGSLSEVTDGSTSVTGADTLSFAGAEFDVTDAGSGEASVGLAEDYLLSADYTPEQDTHSRPSAGAGLTENAGAFDLTDDTVTVAGNSVSLGGSASVAHGDLSDAPTNAHHAKDHDHTGSDISTIPDGGLVEDYLLSADYTPVSDVNAEASLTVDITGDADTVDGYGGDDLAVLSENQTVTGQWAYNSKVVVEGGLFPIARFTRNDSPSSEQPATIKIKGTDANHIASVNLDTGDADWSLEGGRGGDRFDIYEGGVGQQLVIKAGGNTGIAGETNPSCALDVAGRAQATTVEATSTLLIPEK